MRKFKKFILILFIEILLISGCNYSNTAKENKNNYETTLFHTENSENTVTEAAAPLNNSNTQEANENELKVYFIDVGQGDSALLEYNSHYMLIDAGNNSEEKFIVEYLNSKNIILIDYVIGTHPHADHIGGLDAVIDNFDIKKYIWHQLPLILKLLLMFSIL